MILMPVEGLLCSAEVPITNAPPMEIGQAMYTLAQALDVPLVLISEQRVRAEVENWLVREGFLRWSKLLHRDTFPGTPLEFKVSVVNQMASQNQRIRFYVDADPTSVATIVGLGVQSLLAVAPGHQIGRLNVGDGPDSMYRPWDTLVQEIETSHRRRSELTQVLPHPEE